MTSEIISVFAPAKINLYLHITGRTDDGYHTLDSLAAFADIGDTVEIAPAKNFSFHVEGDFASQFSKEELGEGNIVVKAARALAAEAGGKLGCRITLTKNLPLASGIGGGSADAAAVVYGLLQLWDISPHEDFIPEFLLRLGADVPVCFASRATRMSGIGEKLERIADMKDIPAVLVNPGVSCSTADVFKRYRGVNRLPVRLPPSLAYYKETIDFLSVQSNDLYEPALSLNPVIADVMEKIGAQEGCAVARMSGSGATCFGLFESHGDAVAAADAIAQRNPHWWVQTAMIGGKDRF